MSELFYHSSANKECTQRCGKQNSATNVLRTEGYFNHNQFKCIDKYLVGGTLGFGSYGKVKEVFDLDSACRRAVKILKKRNLLRIPNGEESAHKEILIIGSLNHKNVVSLYDVMCDDKDETIYMILDFCLCSVMDMLSQEEFMKFPHWQTHKYFKQLVKGLDYLHSNHIVHKDIKPANLLLCFGDVLKICDFGVSEKLSIFNPKLICNVSQGSPSFQSPEVHEGKDGFAGDKLDIWGCGICLYYMVTGSLPFEGDTIFKIIEKIITCEYEFPDADDEIQELTFGLIKNIIVKDPEKRFTLHQIKNDPWFNLKITKTNEKVEYPCVLKNSNTNYDMSTFENLGLMIQQHILNEYKTTRRTSVHTSGQSTKQASKASRHSMGSNPVSKPRISRVLQGVEFFSSKNDLNK